jgi:hypothetical protein
MPAKKNNSEINNQRYINRFNQNLKDYNNIHKTSYTFEDVQDKFIDCRQAYESKDEKKDRIQSQCMCGHPIQNEFEIINPETGDKMVLGSDCINTYMIKTQCICSDCKKRFAIFNDCDNLCKNCQITTKKCQECKEYCYIKKSEKATFKKCDSCIKTQQAIKKVFYNTNTNYYKPKYTKPIYNNYQYKTPVLDYELDF